MNTFVVAVAAVALWAGSGTTTATAQCFELPQLLGIGSARMAVSHPENIAQLPAAAWQLKPAASPTQEVVWTSLLSDANGIAQAEVRLRPLANQLNPDVLFKTNQTACVRQLRSALKSQGLKPVPVTCLNCEAQRYQATDFEATLYSGLKGNYQFLLVMHPRVVAVSPAPSVSRQP